MSRPIWGESAAGSQTPLLGAGPGYCLPPQPPPHYIIMGQTIIYRGGGGGAWRFGFYLFCLFTDLGQKDSMHFCLGLLVDQPEDCSRGRCAGFAAPRPPRTMVPDSLYLQHQQHASVPRHLLSLRLGQVDQEHTPHVTHFKPLNLMTEIFLFLFFFFFFFNLMESG